jgi:hypothetical protein
MVLRAMAKITNAHNRSQILRLNAKSFKKNGTVFNPDFTKQLP